jgi:phospholipase/carboxylesterase
VKLEIDVIEPNADPPAATVVWLHGLGQDSLSLVPVAERLGLARLGVRSVFPRAPERSTTMLSTGPVRAWFDQKVSRFDRVDLPSLLAVEKQLHDLAHAESARVGPSRVVIAGFSQGAAMALIVGLRHPVNLGAIALYSPFLVTETQLADTRSASTTDVPIWIGHGRRDWIVPMFTGKDLRDRLIEWGYSVSWHQYSGAHEPFDGAADDLRRFIETAVLLWKR